jgi:hypothetical protein
MLVSRAMMTHAQEVSLASGGVALVEVDEALEKQAKPYDIAGD